MADEQEYGRSQRYVDHVVAEIKKETVWTREATLTCLHLRRS